MAFSLVPDSPERLAKFLKVTTCIAFVVAIFESNMFSPLAFTFAVSAMGWLGAELQSYSILTFFFVMTPINVALGIVGIAVVGSLPPSGYQIFLIVLTALMLPVKMLSMVWGFFLRRHCVSGAGYASGAAASTNSHQAVPSDPSGASFSYQTNPTTYNASSYGNI